LPPATSISSESYVADYACELTYHSDQCTGAMPGQQPFGGSRASGTNDKAGTAGLLTRFMSQRTIKEGFSSIDHILYPSNLE
jgi:1-pyrroline-5-carboxylate dehydrogenase